MTRSRPHFTLLLLALVLAACADTDPDPARTEADSEVTVMEDGATGETMRDRVMADQLGEMPPLRAALTGQWRGEAREMLIDFEEGRFEGTYPYGGARGDVPVEGELRIVDEGEDYVTFEVDGAHTLTARQVGDDEIVLSAEGAEDADGLTLRRR